MVFRDENYKLPQDEWLEELKKKKKRNPSTDHILCCKTFHDLVEELKCL